jgi:hypothetical protein
MQSNIRQKGNNRKGIIKGRKERRNIKKRGKPHLRTETEKIAENRGEESKSKK